MKGFSVVESGYIRCKCLSHIEKLQKHTKRRECLVCNRKDFEYGVLHKGEFMKYSELIHRVNNGSKFVDLSNNGLPITVETFSNSPLRKTELGMREKNGNKTNRIGLRKANNRNGY